MKTVVLGADGMLGRAFAARLVDAVPLTFPTVDLTRPETLDLLRDLRPARVINCAAYTDVDRAEQEEALATAINGSGVAHLAERCRAIDATLIHFGTDYVFDGMGTSPYPIEAPLAPQGAYARSKAAGERALAASGVRHLYVRTSWLYAPWAKNFVRTIARHAASKPELKVVADQRGRPTSAEHLAATTLALLDRGEQGFFHVTDGGECTWHELATFVVESLGLPTRVVPCRSEDWPSPVRRPPYSVLDLERVEHVLGPMPSWRENVASVLRRLDPL